MRWSAEAVGADEASASPGASSGWASAPQSLGQRTGTAGVSSPSGGVRPGSGWRRELVDLFGNEGNYEHERGVFDYSEVKRPRGTLGGSSCACTLGSFTY